MKNANTAFWAMLLIATLGMWGCAQQKNGANNTKIRELEARYIKLEEDYRHLVSTSESQRKRLAAIESQRAELERQVEELKVVVAERDELKDQLSARTGERDELQRNFDQFTRDLQGLVGRMQAAGGRSANTLQVMPASRK